MSEMRPATSCSRLAPASMASAIAIAAAGITAPNGTTNVGGLTCPANTADRSRSVEAQVAT